MTQPPGQYPDPYGQPPQVPPPQPQPPHVPQPPQAPQPYGQPGYGQQPPPQPQPPYGQLPQGPGQPYGPPGYPPGAYGPPPKKSGKGWIFVLVGVFVVLLLCCGGGIALFQFASTDGAEDPKDAVNTFLDAVKAQDADAAKEVTCDKEKSEVDVTDLPGSANQPAQVREVLKKVTWTISADKTVDSDTHEVTAQLVIPIEIGGQANTQPIPLTFVVVKEGGWKVCDAKE